MIHLVLEGLIDISQVSAQFIICERSSFNFSAEISVVSTISNKDVSSVYNKQLDFILVEISFKSGTITDLAPSPGGRLPRRPANRMTVHLSKLSVLSQINNYETN